MEIRKKLDDEESKEFWKFAEKVSIEVATWPAWKRGETGEPEAQSCSNDESQRSSCE
jgi:hypothetical protein